MTQVGVDIDCGQGWRGEGLAEALAALRPGAALVVSLSGLDRPADPAAGDLAGGGPAAGDLALIGAALAARPGLGAVNIRLDAARPEAWPALAGVAAAILGPCRARGVPCHLDLVIGAGADVAGAVIAGRGWLAGLAAATAPWVAAGARPRWLIPLAPGLVYQLDGLVSLALREGAEPLLLPLPALGAGPALIGDDRLFAWDFVRYRMLGAELATLTRGRIAAWRALEAVLAEAPRPGLAAAGWLRLAPGPKTGPSAGPAGGALATEEQRDEAAPALALLGPAGDGPRGRSRIEAWREAIADLADVARVGLPAHLGASLPRRPGPDAGNRPIRRALLIGAYGGEHIGDAAILGGVLQRIHARHGTTEAILMTQRPAHSRHLIPMLEVPVAVEVRDYTPAGIRAALGAVDGVVFAGGPLTDLPKQLVRHLYTVTRARARGLPFVMEGIGPGSFARTASRLTARRLVQCADRIAIRTRDDAARPIVRAVALEVGRDPAFDYLATRGATLGRLPARESAEIETLLAGTAGRPLIGVNVRPIGALFTVAPAGSDPASHTAAVEARFVRALAEGINAHARASALPPCFVFVPMNAIQFGMSDLTSAWRIIQHLDPGVDFRIWQADASLDGVVALIRRLPVVISMRFHGVIFALSQGARVIGIDYRIGKRDKVAAVLADAGFEENCRRIDELEAGWLADRLAALSR